MATITVKQETRDNRKKQSGEVFTPNLLVNEMLDRLPKNVWETAEKEFIDPAVGNGQFLIHVLYRKIQKGFSPLSSLKTIFGVDIMKDNIVECRMRLLKIVSAFEEITREHIKIVFQNIVWVDTKRLPDGSLDYDFEFNHKIDQRQIDRWMSWINEQNKLDEVDLGMEDETEEVIVPTITKVKTAIKKTKTPITETKKKKRTPEVKEEESLI